MPWSDKVQQLIENLGWGVDDIRLYEQALTHSSFAHERGHRRVHNERLEFLGDAVLELVISDHLFFTHPKLPEGKLTKLRADLVCEASLARLAFKLGLAKYVRLGKGEVMGGGLTRPSMLADTVEALFGALYLDLGLEKCKKYILELYEPVMLELREGILRRDYKTLLQEYSQARYSVTPAYHIVNESGPDHDKMFEAEVALDSEAIGSGWGRSKKEAEQAAAKEAWNKLSP
ncbi:MAG: ribonuclease III [Bacillota bacterium]|nr:ribonuclease III [Bacillota bacterium]